MELINGKQMFDVITQLGYYNEQKAKLLFYQILNAIVYMHSNLIVHRDLKPNNIMCSLDGNNIKITDFNVSKFSDHYKNYDKIELNQQDMIKMWTYTGTIAFSAPEIFVGGEYDQSIDIWSSGVVLFTMLSGREPFQSEYVEDLIKTIIDVDYDFSDQIWNDVSDQAKDLIMQCLQKDPNKRITPQNALKHPWFNSNDQTQTRNLLSTKQLLEQNLNHLVKSNQDLLQQKKQYNQQQNNELKQKRRSHSFWLPRYVKVEDFLFSCKCYDKVQRENIVQPYQQIDWLNNEQMDKIELESVSEMSTTGNVNTIQQTSKHKRICHKRKQSDVLNDIGYIRQKQQQDFQIDFDILNPDKYKPLSRSMSKDQNFNNKLQFQNGEQGLQQIQEQQRQKYSDDKMTIESDNENYIMDTFQTAKSSPEKQRDYFNSNNKQQLQQQQQYINISDNYSMQVDSTSAECEPQVKKKIKLE